MVNCRLKSFFICIVLILAGTFAGYAQEENKLPLTYQSLLIGSGLSSAYDSYISPLKYSGWSVGLTGEQMKTSRLLKGRLSTQELFYMEYAKLNNSSKSSNIHSGCLEYNYGLYYRFNTIPKLQLWGGVQANALAGVVYNPRNSNNPANAKANLNINGSGMAAYRFHIKKQAIQLRYQVDLPFLGALFSPEFGQSYYEISLGDGSKIIHFAAWHNRFVLRNVLSVELPLNFCTLRLSAMSWLYETRVNELDTQLISNSIYVGISKYFYTVPGTKTDKNKYRYVFE